MLVVFDRYEGEYAVLIDQHNHQIYNIAIGYLPTSVQVGDYLDLSFDTANQPQLILDPEQRQAAEQRITAKLERLRRGDHLANNS